jgi:predicted SprT family Zn-dependent metalloprotease
MPSPPTNRITGDEYTAIDSAYNWFNEQLFGGRLPPCLITLQRKGRSRGYFANDRFGHRLKVGDLTDELALNPDTFGHRSDKDILSTLVHEMCHCWQQHFGTPPRRGYHNREWAELMRSIGLIPSDTGEPGGKQTGQRVSHYILEGGPFDRAAEALLATEFCFNWQSAAHVGQPGKTAKDRSKTKYTCPSCGQNAWAKPEAVLVCGECEERMEAQDEN